MAENKEAPAGKDGTSVATEKGNAKLEHSVPEIATHTRDDALDAGVPVLPGDPSEPQGPEDALGEGPKRGDYSNRQDGADHYESKPVAGGPVTDDDGNVVDHEPTSRLVPQNSRVADVGEVKGVKGGVETA